MSLQDSGHDKPHSSKSGMSQFTGAASATETMPPTADDRLLLLPEVAELLRTSEASLRWKRNRGQTPYLFRLNRRLVAYRSEVLAYIEEQRALDRASV